MLDKLGENCCLCGELKCGEMAPELSKRAHLKRRILMETPEFAALPTLSPLRAGHIMVLPRRHIKSFAQLPQSEHEPFEAFWAKIVKSVQEVFGPVVWWEHGVGKGTFGGCGITHAHLHILPLGKREFEAVHRALMGQFPKRRRLPAGRTFPLTDIPAERSYLIWGESGANSWVATSSQIPSQLVRQLVCQHTGLGEWDWKQLSNWESFRQTYAQLAPGLL